MKLQVQDLVIAVEKRTLLSGLNFEFGQGQLVGLVGPSGCGKTTLLRSGCCYRLMVGLFSMTELMLLSGVNTESVLFGEIKRLLSFKMRASMMMKALFIPSPSKNHSEGETRLMSWENKP